MKLIYFSDIHGNNYTFDKLELFIKKYAIDEIIFGGDVFGYYYEQDYILTKMKELNIKCILGNHDRFFLDVLDGSIAEDELVKKYGSSYKNICDKISKENVEFVRSFKDHIELSENGVEFGFFHGSPSNFLNGRIYPDTEIQDIGKYLIYDYVILGHTHHKMIRKIKNTFVINPGSLGQQRDGKGCSFLLFDTKNMEYEIKIVDYNVNALIAKVKENDSEMNRLTEVLLRKG